MASRLTLEVLTPARRVFSGPCDEVVIPGATGEVGILRYREDARTESLAVRGGLVSVHSNRVTVLADEVALPDGIEPAALEAARASLEGKMNDVNVSLEEKDALLFERDWLSAQQHIRKA